MSRTDDPKRVLLFGASGTIGQAVAQELARAGHAATCVVRSDAGDIGADDSAALGEGTPLSQSGDSTRLRRTLT